MKKMMIAAIAAILFLANIGGAKAAEKSAILAGGCFWCMESDFEIVPGVKSVVSGYTGGSLENPTYRNHADHVEAVKIVFEDSEVSYERLLEIFWRSVDPTDAGGQFCDRGHSYTTAIFADGEAQKLAAEKSKAQTQAAAKIKAPIVTPVLAASTFTDAEDYHQDYYKKNPGRYSYYRRGCGRDARIEQLWGEEAHAGIKHGS